jgi:cation diffusion facilitator CzcD-associated flavoprotein CzcO
MTTVDEPAPLAFDPDALREKYRAERDRRLRPDGNDQYREVTGQFAHYLDDPYVEPITRDPLFDEVDVVVVGGGFGGLLAGARLKEAGIVDVHIIEKGGDFGGTWYWNRYPGAQCDVEAYIYLPLLEEIGYVPKEKYTRAPEILQHSRNIGEHFGLYNGALFQTEVTGVRWDEASSRWLVATNRGDELRARFVLMAAGPLHRPKLPAIEGIETFQGHSFHTSRWDYDYTGGDSEGNLSKLADKRIGIIGTGATAVQCVPHLGAAAKELYVFQRTPSSIDVRNNRPTDPEWAASLEPGWQKRRMENFNTLVSGGFEPEDLVNDGWTDIIGKLLIMMRQADPSEQGPDSIQRTVELADFEKMESIRSRVDTIISDPNTADALKPWYRQFCKRPCFHDEYLDAYNRPNVTLVDTQGQGVSKITETAVVVGDREYQIDCLIYATGFEVGTDYTRRAGYEITGRDGLTLTGKWHDGASTLHGMHTRGFPNLLIFTLSQSGFTVNFPHALDEQSRHAAYILRHVLDNDLDTFEVTQEAEDAWVETILEMSQFNLDFLESCTPGYYNNEGKPNARGIRNGPYGGGSVQFFKLIAEWRDAGTLPGMELSKAAATADANAGA